MENLDVIRSDKLLSGSIIFAVFSGIIAQYGIWSGQLHLATMWHVNAAVSSFYSLQRAEKVKSEDDE